MQNIETVLKKILILLTATLLLAACSSDSDTSVTNDGRRVALQVTGYIADTPHGITRAHGTSWEAGDQIGLYAVNSNKTTPIDDGSNVCYSTTSGGETAGSTFLLFTTSTPIILPATGDIDVYGYYPYSSGATIPTSVDNGSTPISINEPSCELLFQHRLTKLVFNLTFNDFGVINNTSLTIGSQKTTATYNIYTDILTYGSGEANQTITAAVGSTKSGFDKTFEAIVLPNDADNNPAVDCKVTIVVDGGSYSFTIIRTGAATNNTVLTGPFAAGCKYEYNVTVYPFTIIVDTDKYTEQW